MHMQFRGNLGSYLIIALFKAGDSKLEHAQAADDVDTHKIMLSDKEDGTEVSIFNDGAVFIDCSVL
jgi:hypothetical protein